MCSGFVLVNLNRGSRLQTRPRPLSDSANRVNHCVVGDQDFLIGLIRLDHMAISSKGSGVWPTGTPVNPSTKRLRMVFKFLWAVVRELIKSVNAEIGLRYGY